MLREHHFHFVLYAKLVDPVFTFGAGGLGGLGAGAGARGLATPFQVAIGYVPALARPA